MKHIQLAFVFAMVTMTATMLADTAVCPAQDAAPAARRVSPRLIVELPHQHRAGLDAVTFGPDGNLVASGAWDEPIRVYDPDSGAELRRLDVQPCHGAWVAFSPDGQRLVCATGYGIKKFPLLDYQAGKVLKTLEAPARGNRLADFSPDGRMVLMSHAGLWNYNRSQLLLWDIAAAQPIREYCQGTDQPVFRARFSPDGRRILTVQRLWRADGAHRSSARIWNVADGKLVHTFADPQRFLEDAIFSPDGKTVLASCGELAVLWDAESGNKLRTLAGHRGKVQSIAFSPDGKQILTGSADCTAGLWEASTGRRVGSIPVEVGLVDDVAFSPDGRSAAVGLSRRRAIEIWDLDDVRIGDAGPPVREFQLRPYPGTRGQAVARLRDSGAQVQIVGPDRVIAITLPQNHVPDELFACVARFPELEKLVIRFADADSLRLRYLAGLSCLKQLTLQRTNLSDEGLAVIGKLTSLEQLDLSESQLVGWGLVHLRNLDRLRSLNLERSWQLGDEALEHLHQLQNLESLNLLGDDAIHHRAFRRLAKARSLKQLNLSGTRCDDEAMLAIRQLPALQTLVLDEDTNVTAQGVRNLAGSPIQELRGPDLGQDEVGALGGLTRLRTYWSHWPAARDRDLPDLAGMQRLANLRVHLSGTPAGTVGGKSIGELQGLRRLTISGDATADWSILEQLQRIPNLAYLRLVGVPDSGLANLPQLDRLAELELTAAEVHAKGLTCLERLPRLRSLMLDPHTIRDDDLAALALSTSLEELSLSGGGLDEWGVPVRFPKPAGAPRTVSQAALTHLADVPTLRKLDLSYLPITDVGLGPLARFRKLEQLNLNETKITDAGLVHLEGLRQMKRLSFGGTAVTFKAAQQLQRDCMPACHIADNWGDGDLDLMPLVKTPPGPTTVP